MDLELATRFKLDLVARSGTSDGKSGQNLRRFFRANLALKVAFKQQKCCNIVARINICSELSRLNAWGAVASLHPPPLIRDSAFAHWWNTD